MALDLDSARRTAMQFVLREAGFAQLTTLDRHGFPVGRSMTAFLAPDWSVSLVQRSTHARLAQMRQDPRVLVTWVGSPAPGATNSRPHVFDVGRLPPRVVFVRGRAELMDADWTERCYRREVTRQRAMGHAAAPLRSPEQVATDLVGVRVHPRRVRLEGFGEEARAFEWTINSGESS